MLLTRDQPQCERGGLWVYSPSSQTVTLARNASACLTFNATTRGLVIKRCTGAAPGSGAAYQAWQLPQPGTHGKITPAADYYNTCLTAARPASCGAALTMATVDPKNDAQVFAIVSGAAGRRLKLDDEGLKNKNTGQGKVKEVFMWVPRVLLVCSSLLYRR